MDQDVYNQFIEESKAEEAGLRSGIAPDQYVLELETTERQSGENMEVDRNMFITLDGVRYPLSERAKRNILRLSGFSGRLLRELAQESLQEDIRSQMAAIPNLAVSIVNNQIITAFDAARASYCAYHRYIPVFGMTMQVWGSPIEDDTVSFFSLEGDPNVAKSMDEITFIGVHVNACSTGSTRSVVRAGLLRERGNNCWVNPYFYEEGVPSMDGTMYQTLVRIYTERVRDFHFQEELVAFIDKLKSINVPDISELDELFKRCQVAKASKGVVLKCKAEPGENGELLRAAGVDQVNNIWEVFCILTHLGNEMPSHRSGTSLCSNVFKWAEAMAV